MPQPSPIPELPDLPLRDRRRLQNLSYTASQRAGHLSSQVATLRAGLQSRESINATEAMRRAEEILIDYAHVGHGLRDLLSAAKSIYRENVARQAAAGAAGTT